MRILGIDTNTHFLALSIITDGLYESSLVLPADGPARRDDHPKLKTNRNKQFENRSAQERLDVMMDELQEWLIPQMEYAPGTEAPDKPIHYAYVEEPPFVNSIKTYAELTAVVTLTRYVLREFVIPVGLVNVMVWKKETLGNGKADKSEIRQWAIAHIPGLPIFLSEDEMDASVIAWRGAVAAGDVR